MGQDSRLGQDAALAVFVHTVVNEFSAPNSFGFWMLPGFVHRDARAHTLVNESATTGSVAERGVVARPYLPACCANQAAPVEADSFRDGTLATLRSPRQLQFLMRHERLAGFLDREHELLAVEVIAQRAREVLERLDVRLVEDDVAFLVLLLELEIEG